MITLIHSNVLAPLDSVVIVAKLTSMIVILSHAKTEEFVMMQSQDTDASVHPDIQVIYLIEMFSKNFLLFNEKILQDYHVKLT